MSNVIKLALMRNAGLRADWEDRFGTPCSIQECRSNTGKFIWIGARDSRMCLDQEMAASLWPLLKRFAETGELAEEPQATMGPPILADARSRSGPAYIDERTRFVEDQSE